MNTISNISGSINTMQWETVKNAQAEPRQTQLAQEYDVPADSVQVNANSYTEPTLLADEDVEAVMEQTMSMITEDPYAALHVHSGLDASRVAALLA